MDTGDAERIGGDASTASVERIAAEGTTGAGDALPHLDRVQAAFGGHDVRGIQAHVGGPAAVASERLQATAYASGNDVAFKESPSLHTAAHEAAHVVQQRAGVHLKGGLDTPGDLYERHADAVADAVVAGQSAEGLLGDIGAGGGGRAVQRQEAPPPGGAAPSAVGGTGGTATAGAGGGGPYAALMAQLAGYTEGDPTLGPLGLTAAFATNDLTVPEHVKFGPASAMTAVVREDEGLMTARRKHASTGATSHYCRFGALQFIREGVELSLTTHMLGSYNVKMADTPDGKVLFVVENATGRASGTRSPISGQSGMPDVSRANSQWFGTIHQLYYWTEDKYVSGIVDDALAWLGVF